MPRKRAPNGSGNIRLRPNGKYQARVTVGIDPQTGKYKYSFQTFDTETEARKWATGAQAEIDSGTYVKPSKQTMNEWLDIWLETCTDKLKDVGMVKSRVKNYIRPYFGAFKAAFLSQTQILGTYNRIRKDYQKENGKPISEKTIKNIHAQLSTIMQDFVNEGGRKENPCQFVSRRLPKAKQKEMPQLSEAEFIKVWELLPTTKYCNLFTLAFFSGMREGELLGLHWSDVDFENRRLFVCGQLRRPTAKGETYTLTTTKNEKSRVIYLIPPAIEALKQERELQDTHRRQTGSAWNEGEFPGLVFTNETGGHLVHQTVYHNFEKLIAKAGVTRIRLHDTRHYYTYISFASGADPVAVQEQLGHATAKFTQEVYAYAPDAQKQRMAEAMWDYIVKNLLPGEK